MSGVQRLPVGCMQDTLVVGKECSLTTGYSAGDIDIRVFPVVWF